MARIVVVMAGLFAALAALCSVTAFVPSSSRGANVEESARRSLRSGHMAATAAGEASAASSASLAASATAVAAAALVLGASLRRRAQTFTGAQRSAGAQRVVGLRAMFVNPGTGAAPPSGMPAASPAPAGMPTPGGAKRVLVMGGTRFIGCYLVKKLRDLGHTVVVCNRGKTNNGLPERLPNMSDADYQQMLSGISVCVADRKDPQAMVQAISAQGKFDIVFDNNARKLEDVQPLVQAIETTGGCEQFIFMSSAGVYASTNVLPLNEKNEGDPNSRHKDKLSCEKFLDQKGFNWTAIRPVYIYGPLNYNPVERYFFDRVSRGRPVVVPWDGKYITQLGHCEDLANFMAMCIGNPNVAKQVYNLSGEDFVTFDGMAELCAEAAGKPKPKIIHYDPEKVGSPPEGYPKAFPFRGMHFFASIEKAKRDVPNWRPQYSLLDGLKSSFQQDYVARGFDKRDVDFRTDEYIILKGV